MSVVTEQPTGTGTKLDQPPSSQQTAGYSGAYGQPVGAPSGAGVGQQITWMPIPTNVPMNCPPGLEYLTAVDQMLVEQQIELLEALVDIECANKYRIMNSMNQQVYFATEESELCERLCCKNARSFVMHIWDNNLREVMRINRPFQCCAGCCWCADSESCSLRIEIEAPVGQVIGRVKQTKSFWTPHYDITSPNDDVLLKIRGPTCVCDGPCCVEDQNFFIYTPDLTNQIGKISKQWSGLIQEMFTNADKFGICFPMDLDVKMKATLFGALFLIDFMFFESNNN